jgi:hypothetical protein
MVFNRPFVSQEVGIRNCCACDARHRTHKIGVLIQGSYPVHKGHAVHKCTKRNLAVHFPSNDMTARGFFHKTDLASYGGCGRVHLHIYDGRWMENGRPDFFLCICARRGPCARDTIPLIQYID